MQLTPLLAVRHLIELFFLAFHICVALLVGVRISKKDASFRKGFFYLYLLLAFFDVGSILVVSKTLEK